MRLTLHLGLTTLEITRWILSVFQTKLFCNVLRLVLGKLVQLVITVMYLKEKTT